MEERLKRVISSVLGAQVSEITEKSTRETIENWDSLHHISLILAIEEEFGVSFSDKEVMRMFSYAAILEILRGKK